MSDPAVRAPAVLLCGHGSRDDAAVAEFEHLARVVAARLPERRVRHGFLEFARPTIRTTLAALKDDGAQAIDAVPGMLFAAGHAKNDIPSVLNDFAAANPGLPVRYGRDLAVDPLLLRAAAERIEAAQAPGDAPPAESLTGCGTSPASRRNSIVYAYAIQSAHENQVDVRSYAVRFAEQASTGCHRTGVEGNSAAGLARVYACHRMILATFPAKLPDLPIPQLLCRA